VARLVFTPKPVQTKAKIAIKTDQRESSSVPQPPPPQVTHNAAADADKNRDQSVRREDIELERAAASRARREKEKKTLNAQRAQSPAINKSKMDEATRCEARRFMKKQREKRKTEVKKEVDKTFVIKQRLEELRMSTKSAITKKSKRQSPLKVSPPKDSSYYSLDNNKMREIKVLRLKPMSADRKCDRMDEANKTVEIMNESRRVNDMATTLTPLHQLPKRPTSFVQSTTITAAAAVSKENKKPAHDDFRLKVPDVKLSMSINQTTAALGSTKQQIPFWMQSTTIQPYPYNFIWAVRKKLEAFTTEYENEKRGKQQQQTRFELETPQVKRDRRQNRGRKLQQIAHSDDDDDSDTNAKSHDEANTISEISSIRSDLAKSLSHEKQPNDSSVSTSESIFKTLSEDPFVGKKRESVNSAFDRTSFDKKFTSIDVSPNTSEKRSNFLSSTKHQADDVVVFKVPEAPPSNLNDLNGNKLSEEKEEEFRKMLLSFNKSLSHVVEVNHLLSSALVTKSPSIASSSSNTKYSSSFEKNVESASNISEMIENLVKQKPSMPATESHKSDSASSIRTLIEESVEDPPIAYHEKPQELTSSTTTKVTTTTTRTEIIQQQQHEATFEESKLINMFRISESETSLIEGASNASAHDVRAAA
jgi:hypothetical protein